MLSRAPEPLNHSIHHIPHGLSAVQHLPRLLIVVNVVFNLLQHLLIHPLHLDYLKKHRVNLPIQDAVLAAEGGMVVLEVVLLDQRRILCVLELTQLSL